MQIYRLRQTLHTAAVILYVYTFTVLFTYIIHALAVTSALCRKRLDTFSLYSCCCDGYNSATQRILLLKKKTKQKHAKEMGTGTAVAAIYNSTFDNSRDRVFGDLCFFVICVHIFFLFLELFCYAWNKLFNQEYCPISGIWTWPFGRRNIWTSNQKKKKIK